MASSLFSLRVAAATLNQTPLDWAGNLARIQAAIAMAEAAGAQVLVLPELAITGYGCEDAFFAPHVQARALAQLLALLPFTQHLAVAVGLPLLVEGHCYNAAAWLHQGQLLGFYLKQHLADDGLHYEPRWFRPWPKGQMASVAVGGQHVPAGDVLFCHGPLTVGMEICRDSWMGDHRPAHHQIAQGANLILAPNASHFALGKQPTRQGFMDALLEHYPVGIALANLVGNEAGRVIFDGHLALGNQGRCQHREAELGMAPTRLAVADLKLPASSAQNNGPATLVQGAAFAPVPADAPKPTPVVHPWAEDNRQLYRALTLGLWDYARKTRTRGYVLSLSGGADSSACAVLAAQALERAHAELSTEERVAAMPQLFSQAKPTLPVAEWLTCVYQATANSGPATLHSARTLAQGLGAAFHHWDVQPLYDQYLTLTEQALGRTLSWEQDDIPLQNIQSRLRAPGIWMLANALGALLMATSNRSEAAVGYATMDGDTAGGLAPIGGLDKATLLRWLQWAETELPVPALAAVHALTPTAELRPRAHAQTDEADLMPYPLLDAIERLAWAQRLSPAEILQHLRQQGLPYEDAQLKQAIRRFFRLWARNQWKRERYAPAFHVDAHSLDPRGWLRFPILSGGFEAELAELEQTQ